MDWYQAEPRIRTLPYTEEYQYAEYGNFIWEVRYNAYELAQEQFNKLPRSMAILLRAYPKLEVQLEVARTCYALVIGSQGYRLFEVESNQEYALSTNRQLEGPIEAIIEQVHQIITTKQKV